jgi:hypothetical protein
MRKWWHQRLRYAVKDPLAAVKFVLSGKDGVNIMSLKRIATSLGCSKAVVDSACATYLNQVLSDADFHHKV